VDISEKIFKEVYDINDLLNIMSLLREPGGCPWDREQTHKSIRKNFLEETYEVLEAIDTENMSLLKEELGDVLLQVVFHSEIARGEQNFSFSDVVTDICKKLIVRHPHVFKDVQVSNTEEVLKNWEDIKKQTKGQSSHTETLKDVPKVLPALMRSQKVQKRAAKAGYDFNTVYGVLDKLDEEMDELKQAIEADDFIGYEQELGDLLFTAVNACRFLDVDSEEALTKSTDKFINRFSLVEQMANSRGVILPNEDLALLDSLWEEAKLLEEKDS